MNDDARPCWAGRQAFFGGRWCTPCPVPALHTILSAPGAPEIELCDEHFHQVNAAGLVSSPYVGTDEDEARRQVAEAFVRGDL